MTKDDGSLQYYEGVVQSIVVDDCPEKLERVAEPNEKARHLKLQYKIKFDDGDEAVRTTQEFYIDLESANYTRAKILSYLKKIHFPLHQSEGAGTKWHGAKVDAMKIELRNLLTLKEPPAYHMTPARSLESMSRKSKGKYIKSLLAAAKERELKAASAAKANSGVIKKTKGQEHKDDIADGKGKKRTAQQLKDDIDGKGKKKNVEEQENDTDDLNMESPVKRQRLGRNLVIDSDSD